jgi:hypothetical protein
MPIIQIIATLFTSTSVLTLGLWTNSSYFCASLRPPSPNNTTPDPRNFFCPLAPGRFAFSIQIPWGSDRALTTIETRLRAVDPVGNEYFCLVTDTTPLDPILDGGPDTGKRPYGRAQIILWATVGLTLAYWLFFSLARISSAWSRGNTRPGTNKWSILQSGGFIMASAISGERFRDSPSLLRFCTPSMRDVVLHTQWCAALAMVAVQWPRYVYPLLTRCGWATLSFSMFFCCYLCNGC